MPQLRISDSQRGSASLHGGRFCPQRLPLAHVVRQRALDATLDSEADSRELPWRISSRVQKLEQRLAQLENRLKNRSRSPRRQQNQRALPALQQLLVLPASNGQPKGKAKGQKSKGKGKNKGGKTQSSNTSQGFWNFQANRLGSSQDASCSRKHIFVGCGKDKVQYDSCGCLESKIPRA